MKEVVKCHGTSAGETWSIEIFDGERLVASAHGFDSAYAAREGGDYLRAGIAANWQLSRQVLDAEINAGVEAYREDEEFQRECDSEMANDGGEPTDDTGHLRRRVRAILSGAQCAWAAHVVNTQKKGL